MTWIQTYPTCRKFYPLEPVAGDIDIRDVARSLAMKCRFTGFVRTFYSVAQHCYLVSTIVPEEDALWGLLHDAAEAYLADIAAPIRPLLPDCAAVEAGLCRAVATRFGLSLPMPHSVEVADQVLRMTEKRDFLGPSPEPWSEEEVIHPLEQHLEAWPWQLAESRFLEQFEQLGGPASMRRNVQ
jgi:hypothetical protein